MGGAWILVSIVCFSFLKSHVSASKATCHNPYYGKCYGIPHNCPPGCPKLCEVDCRLCKPYCACDKPGAVCQDPRFIGGDGIMFYFHGRKDEDFCLVSDSNIHINAHFIGKKSKKGRDFTWVQSIGILFDSHQLYLGALNVSKWKESIDSLLIRFEGETIKIPFGKGKTWRSPDARVRIQRRAETNAVKVEVAGLFTIVARVVPITPEESRVHKYDITDDDCFAHLELNFKFNALSTSVNGVLGQTYRPSYRSPVKMEAPMPVMGGVEKFSSSHIFGTDCAVANFSPKMLKLSGIKPHSVSCGGGNGGEGIVCRRLRETQLKTASSCGNV